MTRFSGALAAGFVAVAASAATPAGVPAATPPAAAASAHAVVAHSQRAETYRARRYGVDHLQVRSTSSGASLEFRYRVLDAAKANVLNDKRATPYLLDRTTGIKLTVPTMEKVGTLRQTSTPEAGREYWMVFSNPGKLVKQGQRVDVVVGTFRAEGLTVE